MCDIFCVAMLAVDSVVHSLHLLVGNPACQVRENLSDLGMTPYRFLPYDWNGLVRGKIVPVIFEHKQVHSRDETVGSVPRSQINLVIS